MNVKYSKHKSSSKKQYQTTIEELCHQFSLEDLKKSTNNFDKDRKIGESQYYIVYKGYLKHNGENDYPIALMRMRNIVEDWQFQKEIELNFQLCHPNLTSFIGFCDQKDEKILVCKNDDIVNGSLNDHLLSRDMESLTWKKRLEICIGAAKGLHYLHTGVKRSIFHRDIKPSNILLGSNMVPKLSQLGLSLQGKLSNSKSNTIKVNIISGTPVYMAPECLATNIYTDKCDVYSFGMVLLDVACTNYNLTTMDKIRMFCLEKEIVFLEDYNMVLDENFLTGDNLWDQFLDAEIIDPILMRSIAIPCLVKYMDIVKRCLKYDPDERPAMGEVEVELEHALALQEEEEKFWKEDTESLSWKKRLEICIGAAKGLHYLHTGAKCPIFHRDITTQNILLDSKMVPKLTLQAVSLQGKFSKLNLKLKPIEDDIICVCKDFYLTTRDKMEIFRLEEEIAFLEDHNEILDQYILTGDNFCDKFLDAEIIDPILMRLIAIPCLVVFLDILKRCLKLDPNERPAMGEVEVELEHALALQEEEEKFWKE